MHNGAELHVFAPDLDIRRSHVLQRETKIG